MVISAASKKSIIPVVFAGYVVYGAHQVTACTVPDMNNEAAA
jgi:hypothetical protein